MDLAWRAQKKGWRAILYPAAICFHEGNSSATDIKLRQFLSYRNRKLMISKNEIPKRRFGVLFLWAIYDLPRLFYLLLSNKYFLNSLKIKL